MPNPIELPDATELARLTKRGEVSAEEVVSTHLERIQRHNGRLNAIVTLAAEQALERARRLDARCRSPEERGPLHGLPLGIKDLFPTAGLRTTFGSSIYRDHVPHETALHVTRMEAAGGIVLGKTNTPEFGAGSQTFNEVFGATRNPYDPSRTCGGSSGGAAVSLATGMVALADGSDLGGSLRNPASFCNVVGLRPSAGRVPVWPCRFPWQSLNVVGPMARTVKDLSLLLSVMSGPDARDPIALPEPGSHFSAPLERDFGGTLVAVSADLGDLPLDPEVRRAFGEAVTHLETVGCRLEEQHPELGEADAIFQVQRAFLYAAEHGEELARHRDSMKDTVVWNIEKGLGLTAPAIARAEEMRGELHRRMLGFMKRYRFLALPVCQVPPFPVDQAYVTEIDGQRMQTYIDWMASCYRLSVTGLPAIAVPAGFTSSGLPVGIQLVGPWHQDFELLQLAHAFEQATGFGRTRPVLASQPD